MSLLCAQSPQGVGVGRNGGRWAGVAPLHLHRSPHAEYLWNDTLLIHGEHAEDVQETPESRDGC